MGTYQYMRSSWSILVFITSSSFIVLPTYKSKLHGQNITYFINSLWCQIWHNGIKTLPSCFLFHLTTMCLSFNFHNIHQIIAIMRTKCSSFHFQLRSLLLLYALQNGTYFAHQVHKPFWLDLSIYVFLSVLKTSNLSSIRFQSIKREKIVQKNQAPAPS